MTFPTNESFGKEILFLSELLNIGLGGYPHLHLERTHLEKLEGKRHKERKKKQRAQTQRQRQRDTEFGDMASALEFRKAFIRLFNYLSK